MEAKQSKEYFYDLINTYEKKSIWDTFPNCARSKDKGLDFTHLPIIEAYREYLNYQWFNTDKYKVIVKSGRRWAVAKAPSGSEAWRVLGMAKPAMKKKACPKKKPIMKKKMMRKKK